MGFAFNLPTRKPLNMPVASPIPRPKMMVVAIPLPPSSMATIVTLISDTIAPTERSKLPLIIIQQTPTVTIPLIDDWRSTLIRLRVVRKRGFRTPVKHDQYNREEDLRLPQQKTAETIELAPSAQRARDGSSCKRRKVHDQFAAIAWYANASSPPPSPELGIGKAHGPNSGGEWLAVSRHSPLSTGGTGCNRVRILGLIWGIPCGVLGQPAGRLWSRGSVNNIRFLSQQIIGLITLSVKAVSGVGGAPAGGAGATTRGR